MLWRQSNRYSTLPNRSFERARKREITIPRHLTEFDVFEVLRASKMLHQDIDIADTQTRLRSTLSRIRAFFVLRFSSFFL
jgi:hypothetical protein